MNLIKSIIAKPILKKGFDQNTVSKPSVIELKEKSCIGFSITTTMKDDKKKEDIPPFFHDVYDNGKLNQLWHGHDRNMYCIFNLHPNMQDFDYYIATDNHHEQTNNEYKEITIPAGKYVTVEFLKINHTAVSKIMMYLRAIWLRENGYKARNSPAFILYDERFHSNYEQYGCVGGNYPGRPVATYFLPVED